MNPQIVEFEVPKFTEDECPNGVARNGITKGFVLTTDLNLMFATKIYPNGLGLENQDYVSIKFKQVFNVYHIKCIPKLATSLHCTMSIVDTYGESHLPQSLVIELNSYASFPSVELKRFVSRRVLLESQLELLPKDTLTLRCEVVYFYDLLPEHMEGEEQQNRFEVAKIESWFIPEVEPELEGEEYEFWALIRDDIFPYSRFDVRNPNSPLFCELRKKSVFFADLFEIGRKVPSEGDEYIPIYHKDYNTFFNLLCYVRFKNIQHVSSVKDYCELYKMADRYQVFNLPHICSQYIQQHLTWKQVINALEVAVLYNDEQLFSVTFKFALCNWKGVRQILAEIAFDKPLVPFLKDLVRVAWLLNLEGESPINLTEEHVLSCREQVLNSPPWASFATEKPDLARSIVIWLNEFKQPTEEYHVYNAAICDFYS